MVYYACDFLHVIFLLLEEEIHHQIIHLRLQPSKSYCIMVISSLSTLCELSSVLISSPLKTFSCCCYVVMKKNINSTLGNYIANRQ